jgi:proline iminopeptidase
VPFALAVAVRPAASAEGYVPVEGGLRLHYRVIGHGPDTVVVPADVWWGSRADGLARGRKVVLYDPRGRGLSDEVKELSFAGMEYEVRDLEALRRHLSLERVSLVGWSYLGAMVALYAARYPERVEAVVQVGAMPLRHGPHWEAFVKDREARRSAAAEAKLAKMREAGAPERDPVGWCRAFWEALVVTTLARPDTTGMIPSGVCDSTNERPRPDSVMSRLIAGLGAWDWTAEARSVRARVLTVHGLRDNIPLDSSREWARPLPKARLLVLDASGHFPFAEQPAEFTRAVDAFLGGAWPEGGVEVR